MWGFLKKRRRRRTASSVTKHYLEHKEQARELTLARLAHFNQHYNLAWKRVAIRNQRRCWGSCSSLKNLNFNYKILFLPAHLRDYIIVHEMCHLVELNHREKFWSLVAEQMPNYKNHVAELKQIDKGGHSMARLLAIQKYYLSSSKEKETPKSSVEVEDDLWCESCGREVVCSCGFEN